jgi:hypothetical protein
MACGGRNLIGTLFTFVVVLGITTIPPALAADAPAETPATGPTTEPAEAEGFRLPPDLSDLGKDYRWETAAATVLSKTQTQQLSKDKLIILTQGTYTQVYDGYTWTFFPPFITSDSILAGYHRLFEDSVLRLEEQRAKQLEPILRRLQGQLELLKPAPQTVANTGATRARLMVGVAVQLLTGERSRDRSVDAIARVIQDDAAARADTLPEWLAKLQLDYDRMRPRGFYANTQSLQRYFRAVAWLQSVPFFVDDDDAFATICSIRLAQARLADEDGDALREYLRSFEALVGEADDLDLRTLESPGRFADQLDADALRAVREELTESIKQSGRSDPLVLDPVVLDKNGKPRPHVRILSALRTPDAALFRRTTGPALDRPMPSGLDVAAMLGSTDAIALLREAHGEALAQQFEPRPADPNEPGQPAEAAFRRGGGEEGEFDEITSDNYASSLYDQYLDCLGALFDKPDAKAPALFASNAWKRKSLQTVCGGWAQLRHTWALTAKEAGGLFGGPLPPCAGLVEPNPEFFGRLADVVDRSERMLARRGAFKDADELHDRWHQLARVSRRLEALAHKQLRDVAFSDSDNHFLRGYGTRLADVMGNSAHGVSKDDSPRAASVFHLAPRDLIVATGRPTMMFVLYPYGGREVLCLGVVTPYFEFAHERRLTDDDWLKLLDSDKRPPVPKWLTSIYNDEPPLDGEKAAGAEK